MKLSKHQQDVILWMADGRRLFSWHKQRDRLCYMLGRPRDLILRQQTVQALLREGAIVFTVSKDKQFDNQYVLTDAGRAEASRIRREKGQDDE